VPWNAAVLEQRIGRVHRIGQRAPVRVVNFVAEGTIEQGMLSHGTQNRGAAGRRRLDVSRGADAEPRGVARFTDGLAALLRSMLP
jgi:hypothetical protein